MHIIKNIENYNMCNNTYFTIMLILPEKYI
ncbi:Uncharacterised protein [Chryseobacterium indologenes]|nr:Uncharacterised protein [Chryseobacterium indologenes]